MSFEDRDALPCVHLLGPIMAVLTALRQQSAWAAGRKEDGRKKNGNRANSGS